MTISHLWLDQYLVGHILYDQILLQIYIYEILTLKELESLNNLYTLCLLHDIGKSVSNFSWIFRIFSELKIIKNKKSKMYLNHEIIGLEYMKKLSIDDSTLKYYQKELIDNKHFVLDKTDY